MLKVPEIQPENPRSQMNKKCKYKSNIQVKKERHYSTDALDIEIGTIKVELDIKPEVFQGTSTNYKEEIVGTEDIYFGSSKNTKKKRKDTERKSNARKIKKETNDEEITYLCETCNKFFATWSQLKNHEKAHITKKKGQFSCNKCEQSFSFKGNLQRHMILHGKKKLFFCKYCDKKFKRNYLLEDHIRSHKGIKPYSCENCQLEFTTKGALTQHNEVHRKKKFECSVCGKLFRRKFNLIQHERVHSNEKPYACTECNRKFAYKCNLKDHSCVPED